MLSLFNPYVLLGIALAMFSAFTGGYWKGGKAEVEKQQLEIAALNAEAREKEQALVTAVTTQATKLQKANQDAKLLQQKHNAYIESGLLKLRVAVKASDCPVPTTADATITSGANLGTATAELDGETSKALIALTAEGDAAIRKLNTCIALYNEARETLRNPK
jgi:hypothetical protein